MTTFWQQSYDYFVEPNKSENRNLSLKDRFFANALNPMVLIAVAVLVSLLPQAVNILVGLLGIESEFILNTLTVVVENATKISGVLFGAAFLLFFFRRR
ncbi:hypothetical protein A2890_00345 [candidate division WWE3 bacterium RIFCSPLOWO2_01_FULL_53_14]|uniref:Uncharacterized protein n=1 Tax=candidate division WWE3 bacterium RIFCSPLOWO2_01_FULL_53_14 TaxID=1802628 RepID=A0A1F4W0X0_UNCKA|nr:MAG: hypothetical protein A2890_00345 [candidate division WWE3 bacterium RIFCSPLOWO2_01_FULL_53_14]